jgi:hypothetical protein
MILLTVLLAAAPNAGPPKKDAMKADRLVEFSWRSEEECLYKTC